MNITKELATAFVQRSEYLGLKGKKRDDEAVAYFVGAASVLNIVGRTKESEQLSLFAAHVLAYRGFRAVELATTTEG